MNSHNTVISSSFKSPETLAIELNQIRYTLDALMKEMRAGFGWPKSENSGICFHLKNAEAVISKLGKLHTALLIVSNEKRISALERLIIEIRRALAEKACH